MKTKNLIWWVLILASIDILIKVIIDSYFLDIRFTIIPGLVEFKPTFNDIAPYFIQLLGHRIEHVSHVILVCIIAVAACFVYKRALKKEDNPKCLNAAFALVFAAILSSLTAQLIYKGILDYIYLKPLFVFDLKDVYANCGAIILLFYIYNRDKYKINLNKIRIIKAEPQDASEILELQHQAFQSEAALYNNYDIEPLNQTLSSIEADLENYTFLKAVYNNKIVGSIKLKAEDSTCWVGRLIVSPNYQRQGIGRKLLLEAENIFPDIHTYQLFTGTKSVHNIRLYESVGYQKTEEYTDEKNPGVALIRMKKTISILIFVMLLGIGGLFPTSCTYKKEQEKVTVAPTPTRNVSPPARKDTLPAEPLATNNSEYDLFGTRRLLVPPPRLTGKAVELVAVPQTYPDTVSRISVVLYNSDAGKITSGLHYRLEKYEEKKWQPLNFPEHYATPDIGLTMNNGISLEFVTSLHPEVNHYTPGKYRVVKENLFKFDTDFVVDSAYNIHMTHANHLGDAFEMTVPEITNNSTQKIDTLRVIISNNSTNQELINSDDFILAYHDKDNQYYFLAKHYSDFKEEIYSLQPGKSMEFAIPVMSDKYRLGSGIKHSFGPGKYTITKWSKVDLYAEFKLKKY